MATKPRKPKLLKYPKKPKQSSSTTTLERYLNRVKLIDKTNKERMQDYNKAVRDYENDKKRHASLVKAISGIGSPSVGAVKRKSTRRKTTAKKRSTKRRTTKKRSIKRRRR